MYISISPQKSGGHYASSSADYVRYLEKENEHRLDEEKENFFNASHDDILPESVTKDIDGNTAKLKTSEARFYAITINPSARELANISTKDQLKDYTRELMKSYASCFNREIDGGAVQPSDIKYYAKLETQRYFKGTDWQVKENQPYASQILALKNQQRKIDRGEEQGSITKLQKQIDRLEQQAPHKINGLRISQGMAKPGNQSHIHIIVSRKDASNLYGLSPGSKYKASEVMMNGKLVKRGFDRDRFFASAEKIFDQKFQFQRNYVESYASRKLFLKQPKSYMQQLAKLPTAQKKLAFQILRQSGLRIPAIPTNQVQLAIKSFNQLRKGLKTAIKSSSIGY
ncbi:MobB family relaxase [Zunongwangia atlantica]|uniref:Mobilization protein B n=2 Tax=Zunongwangia TaxID=417127 RepID=A0A1Y1SY64_9FLAO|nr:MobB family relaxase [Zunongwangia atlantica]ORL43502.1 mobilization protein B [Zunongwangia atlantica 22II14-10F7]